MLLACRPKGAGEPVKGYSARGGLEARDVRSLFLLLGLHEVQSM